MATTEAPPTATSEAPLWHVLSRESVLDELGVAPEQGLTSEEAASGLSVVLIEAGKPEEAETVLVKATEASPKGASLWNNLGVARIKRGDYAGAVQAFQKAIDLDGNFEIARANLARAEQLAGLERASS